MAEVERRKINELIAQLSNNYSKKATEDFFGIKIKVVEKGKRYNIYKDGELVLPCAEGWQISQILEFVAGKLGLKLCHDEELEEEENLEETLKKRAELEEAQAKQDEEDKKNFYLCPDCLKWVRKGSHFH